MLSFPQQTFAKPLPVRPAVRTSTRPRPGPPEVLGDVVISLADAAKNAANLGQDLDREVCFLLVHGILHLCGHDHMEPKEERVMLAAQRKLMAALAKRRGPRGGPAWRGCAAAKKTTRARRA